MDAKEEALAALGEAEAARSQMDAHEACIHEICVRLTKLFSELRDHVTAANPTSESSVNLRAAAARLNEQYLELEVQLPVEARNYTTVSNIMKTKHDTVKSTISNIH